MYELDSSILAVLTTKIDGNERSARLSKMNCKDWSWIWPNMGLSNKTKQWIYRVWVKELGLSGKKDNNHYLFKGNKYK